MLVFSSVVGISVLMGLEDRGPGAAFLIRGLWSFSPVEKGVWGSFSYGACGMGVLLVRVSLKKWSVAEVWARVSAFSAIL